MVENKTKPFQITTRKITGSNLYQAKVNLQSSLLKSIIPNDRQTINGLDTWFNLDGNDFIWLSVACSIETFGLIISANIESWGLGSSPTFTPSANPGSSDGPFTYFTTFDGNGNKLFTQTAARVPIAQSVAGDQGQPIITQLLFTNLIWQRMRYASDSASGSIIVPIFYPQPIWSAPTNI